MAVISRNKGQKRTIVLLMAVFIMAMSMFGVTLVFKSRPAIAAGALIYVNAATGSDVTGNGSSGFPYKSITKGMQAAVRDSDDTVVVAAGTYNVANGETFPIGVKEGVALLGSGASTTTIQGNGSSSVIIFWNQARQTTKLDGFKITGGSASNGGGLWIDEGATPTITRNIITGNTATRGGGIFCGGSAPPIITNNLIYGNTATQDGGGICCFFYADAVISNNTIVGNTAPSGGGISATSNSNPTIFNCIVWGNGDDLAGCSATYSDIEDGDSGTGNIAANPIFVPGDYRLQPTSPCINTATALGAPSDDLAGNARPQGIGYDMGAYEQLSQTLYVNAATGSDVTGNGSSGSPYKSITKGMQAAVRDSDDTVVVAAGTYNVANGETFPIGVKEGVALLGSGASTTTIQGNGSSSVIIFWNQARQTTKLDGFKITGGSASNGGGLWIDEGATPTITRNIITGNTATRGGGIFCGGSAPPIITNNLIHGNTATQDGGGICCFFYADAVISNNTIVGNTAPSGGGISATSNSNPTIFNCIVWGNGDDLAGCSATYSDIEDGDSGTGNVPANPLFVNSGTGDYHLQAESPCIDSGTNAGVLPTTDFDWNARPLDGNDDGAAIYDMGCYERVLPPKPIYRFYNFIQGAHFYTMSDVEKAYLEGPGGNWTFRYEGVAGDANSGQAAGTLPVYRFYNFRQGVHFYTTNEAEKAYLEGPGGNWTFRYESVSYYASPTPASGLKPVHRFYNFLQGVHFYTSNQAEATNVNDNLGWTFRYEGIAYYVPDTE